MSLQLRKTLGQHIKEQLPEYGKMLVSLNQGIERELQKQAVKIYGVDIDLAGSPEYTKLQRQVIKTRGIYFEEADNWPTDSLVGTLVRAGLIKMSESEKEDTARYTLTERGERIAEKLEEEGLKVESKAS